MRKINKKVLYPDLSYKICGLCYKIHNEFGRFMNEKQYADAFENLLKLEGIKYEREKPLSSSLILGSIS